MSFVVERGNGTSFAVAAAAGVAALWLSYHGKNQLVERYGLAGVPVVFKELLERTCAVPATGWNTDDFGHGIVDALALLRADLPPVPRAVGLRGVAPRAVSEDRIGTELLLHYFPDVPRTDVERAVAGLLGVTENRLPGRLVQVGDELAFQIATDPGLRSALAQATAPRTRGLARGTARNATLSTRAVRERLTQSGVSRRLQRALDGRG
jgi:thermitase